MKTQSIRVRMTEKERSDLDNLAKKLCMTRSELVRQFLAVGVHKQETVPFVKWDNDTIMAIRDCNMLIAKIGININQIARKCNTGDMNVTLMTEIQSLQQVLEEMKKAVAICQ
ncbi:MAG: plasmid mobilization relaxosome protein MobC [Roseburia sp.]